MADYLATNTPRLRLLQTGPRGSHHMTFRLAPGTSQAAGITAVTPVAELMLPFCFSTTSWASAEWANEGSDIFLPVTWTPITHAVPDAIADNAHPYGLYLNFMGRSLGGSRCAWYLFNVPNAISTANNRLTVGENSNLAALLAAMNANTPPLVGIDQTAFVMKGYGNSGINDKVAKKSRALV